MQNNYSVNDNIVYSHVPSSGNVYSIALLRSKSGLKHAIISVVKTLAMALQTGCPS